MGADNVIISGSTLTTVVSSYQNSMAGYPSFSAIAASGSGLISNTDVPNQTLAERTSGMYNNYWQVKTGRPRAKGPSFWKRVGGGFKGRKKSPNTT